MCTALYRSCHPNAPLVSEVIGLDLREVKKGDERIEILQKEMASRGYLVFRKQGVYTGDEQVL